MRYLQFLAIVVALRPLAICAEVGDPTIRTDHPQYAGEGAFQTVQDCVRFATAGKEGAQDRAIAMYLWLLNHQWHLMSPQEWCVPGRVPDTAETGDYEMVVFDANRARFSYGYGLCGTVHSWNEPYWRALGMPPRRRAFPGHVNSEIHYDGSWHAFDTDMAGLLFRKDGVVAGYDDITTDPSLAESVKPPLPHYPFAWPGDFDTMKRGWEEVAKGGNWYSLYNSGYAAHPGIVHLRASESLTRWYDRDHYGGPAKRRFWHDQPGGPARNWTFFDNGAPRHDGAESNSRGNATYCNGEFVYEPELSNGRYREGTLSQTENVAFRAESPRLFSRDGEPASVTFRHFSPYVICGDPADDANPMSGPATGGLVLEGSFVGNVKSEVSADEGQTWSELSSTGDKAIDLTDLVKGRYGWQIRFSWSGRAGINALKFTTVTQVCQAIYPRLKPNGTDVTYRAGNRGVVAVLPNLGLDESSRFEATEMRSKNVAYQPRTKDNRLAYQTTDNKPGSVVFPISAPGTLVEITAAVRYQIRVPPPEGCDDHLDVSTDGGATWTPFARAEIPADNEFSSGWLSGRADVDAADTHSALVRAVIYAGGYRTGLIDVQLYGVFETGSPQAVEIEYGWEDGKELRTHREAVPAGTDRHEFRIETPGTLRDRFVRISTR